MMNNYPEYLVRIPPCGSKSLPDLRGQCQTPECPNPTQASTFLDFIAHELAIATIAFSALIIAMQWALPTP